MSVKILELAERKIVLLDGAMGTLIQAMNLPVAAYDGHEGCYEILVLSAPEEIEKIHRDYLEAGSDVIQTDTFGANPQVLGEYGLAERVEQINEAAAQIARRTADAHATPARPRFVSGSIGPGTKLATLGQVGYDELYAGYRRQVEGLLAGGVDLLKIETVQDLLQAKAALAAARDAMAGTRTVPLYVSVTIEQTGSLLTGADIGTAIAVLRPFEIDVLGLNCATGPEGMRPHLEVLAQHWPGMIGVYPNAGLPVLSENGICYPESPEELARVLSGYLDALPIRFVGGCCGTTPAHIRRLAEVIAGRAPKPGRAKDEPALAGLFGAVTITQQPPPLLIGERANATGSKAFREALLANNHETAFEILNEQAEHGSHAADLSVAYAGEDEKRHMRIMMERAAKECRLPICIDTNDPETIELALKLYPGRPIINSINLEDGGAKADRIGALARRFGAAVIALTIDETGMALTTARKLEVARRLVERCEKEYGLRRGDVFLDPLTFSIGSGDPTLRDAARETLEAIKRIKRELPGVHTSIGLSNVSFGLKPAARRVLNSVFLEQCLQAGLDAAILNPRQIVPLAQLDAGDIRAARALVDNRPADGDDPLEAFIRRFADARDFDDGPADAQLTPEESVYQGILKGRINLITPYLDELLGKLPAENILNDILVPAMKEVGELFAAGKMQLPFVLRSAEAMKKTVDLLHGHFTSTALNGPTGKLVIATVRGDVHDIGKNLVDIIVSNNGFEVVNLGTKAPIEKIIAAAREHRADAIGMSGLLVSSAMVMADNLRAMAAAGLTTPVLVGGAALTRQFVKQALKPAYGEGQVIYCADAFAGLHAMQDIEAGRTPPEPVIPWVGDYLPMVAEQQPLTIQRVPVPAPPFLGSRMVENVELDTVLGYLNRMTLFRGRWGYRRGMLSREEHRRIILEEARPKYEELVRIVKDEGLFKPRFVYGFFPARREGDSVLVEHDGRTIRFPFPRRRREPKICISDFVRSDGDVIGFYAATIGGEAAARGQEIFARYEYLHYFLLHGLAVETTDALAEYAHYLMRREWGICENRTLNLQELVTQKFRGSRYSFGYPACPDLAAHELVWQLLDPARIGVELTETHHMSPEYSTAAIVVHHPQAKHFFI